jgi:hypothetical protein
MIDDEDLALIQEAQQDKEEQIRDKEPSQLTSASWQRPAELSRVYSRTIRMKKMKI